MVNNSQDQFSTPAQRVSTNAGGINAQPQPSGEAVGRSRYPRLPTGLNPYISPQDLTRIHFPEQMRAHFNPAIRGDSATTLQAPLFLQHGHNPVLFQQPYGSPYLMDFGTNEFVSNEADQAAGRFASNLNDTRGIVQAQDLRYQWNSGDANEQNVDEAYQTLTPQAGSAFGTNTSVPEPLNERSGQLSQHTSSLPQPTPLAQHLSTEIWHEPGVPSDYAQLQQSQFHAGTSRPELGPPHCAQPSETSPAPVGTTMQLEHMSPKGAPNNRSRSTIAPRKESKKRSTTAPVLESSVVGSERPKKRKKPSIASRQTHLSGAKEGLLQSWLYTNWRPRTLDAEMYDALARVFDCDSDAIRQWVLAKLEEGQELTDDTSCTAESQENRRSPLSLVRSFAAEASGRCLKQDYKKFHPQQQQPSQPHKYRCTSRCGLSFKRKDDWRKHEEINRPQHFFVCCVCLQDTKADVTVHHRRDKFRSHAKKNHTQLRPEEVVEQSKVEFSGACETHCGYCGEPLSDWQERTNHVAAHFEGTVAPGPNSLDVYQVPWVGGPGTQEAAEDTSEDDACNDEDDDNHHDAGDPANFHGPDYGAGQGDSNDKLDKDQQGGGTDSMSKYIDPGSGLGDVYWAAKGFKACSVMHIDLLGRGSHGIVDRVRVSPSDCIYARKTFRPIMSSSYLRAEFLREVQIMKRIDHPHVAKIIAAYGSGSSYSIIMSPAAECNLSQYLSSPRMNGQKRSKLRRWFGCLASGLSYLHSSHIRHADIKPANILILSSKICYADFSCSRELTNSDWSSPRNSPMTPMYVAPEIARRQRRGLSADVWALACVFVEMMTVMWGFSLVELYDFIDLAQLGSIASYQARIPVLFEWLTKLERQCSEDSATHTVLELCRSMLRIEASDRPAASQVLERLPSELSCLDESQSIHSSITGDIGSRSCASSHSINQYGLQWNDQRSTLSSTAWTIVVKPSYKDTLLGDFAASMSNISQDTCMLQSKLTKVTVSTTTTCQEKAILGIGSTFTQSVAASSTWTRSRIELDSLYASARKMGIEERSVDLRDPPNKGGAASSCGSGAQSAGWPEFIQLTPDLDVRTRLGLGEFATPHGSTSPLFSCSTQTTTSIVSTITVTNYGCEIGFSSIPQYDRATMNSTLKGYYFVCPPLRLTSGSDSVGSQIFAPAVADFLRDCDAAAVPMVSPI